VTATENPSSRRKESSRRVRNDLGSGTRARRKGSRKKSRYFLLVRRRRGYGEGNVKILKPGGGGCRRVETRKRRGRGDASSFRRPPVQPGATNCVDYSSAMRKEGGAISEIHHLSGGEMTLGREEKGERASNVECGKGGLHFKQMP